MSTQTTSEYMLLFRGTDCHKGLSPEEIQQVVTRMKTWSDHLTEQEKSKPGNHGCRRAKSFQRKRVL